MSATPLDLDRARQEIEACAPEFESSERPWNQAGLTLVQVGRSLLAELEKVIAERDESIAIYRQWVSDKTADTKTVIGTLRKADAELKAAKAEVCRTNSVVPHETPTTRDRNGEPRCAMCAETMGLPAAAVNTDDPWDGKPDPQCPKCKHERSWHWGPKDTAFADGCQHSDCMCPDAPDAIAA